MYECTRWAKAHEVGMAPALQLRHVVTVSWHLWACSVSCPSLSTWECPRAREWSKVATGTSWGGSRLGVFIVMGRWPAVCLQENGQDCDLCKQVSANIQGLVTQLPTALLRDASVTVRSLKGHIPLVFFFLTVISMVYSLSLHNLMIQDFGSNSGLCSPILLSIHCYTFCPQATYSLVVCKVMLWAAGFKNI